MDVRIRADFKEIDDLQAQFEQSQDLKAKFGQTTIVQTDDYNDLYNKPSIENVILQGNKTIDQIGVGTMTVQEIEKILYLG